MQMVSQGSTAPEVTEALDKDITWGLSHIHCLKHVFPMNHGRLLVYGVNPRVPGMWCRQIVHVPTGETLDSKWQVFPFGEVTAPIVTKEGFIAWQVMPNASDSCTH